MGQWRFWGFPIILNLVQCQKVTFLNTCSSINLFRAKNIPLHLKSRKNAYILWCVCNGALRCNIRIGFVSSVGRAHRGSKRKWWGPWFFSSSEAVEAEGAAHLLLCREAVMRRLRRSSLFFFPSTSSPRLLFAASVFFLWGRGLGGQTSCCFLITISRMYMDSFIMKWL